MFLAFDALQEELMKRIFVFVVNLVLFTSCTSTYNIKEITNYSENEKTTVCSESKFLVTVPEDAFYGSINYPNSGKMAAYAIRDALSKHTASIHVDSKYQAFQDIPNEALTPYDYIIVPRINKWIDYATEWSGKRDVLEIQIEIYNTSSEKRIHSVLIYGKSRLLSFGGDHPQDLLYKPVSEYIDSLFD